MLLKKTSGYKDFNNATLHARVIALNKSLQDNYGKQLAITNKVLDELYQIILFCLEHDNQAALLEAAESLKLAYGLAWEGKAIRSDEYAYWREIVLATLAKSKFQAVEYLVESSKNLFKLFADKRDVIVETLKIIADMAVQEKKFFIAAAVLDILLYRLHRLEKENKKTTSALIGCIASIGYSVLKGQDYAFFKEICTLLCQQLNKITEVQEVSWDRLLSNWLSYCLKEGLYQSYQDWHKLFVCYRQLRPGAHASFYAELVTLTGRYVLKLEEGLVQAFFADLLKYTWLRATHLECILCAQAFSEVFKSITSIVVWEKAIFICKPFFLFCFHLIGRIDKKDKWTALNQTLLNIYIAGVSEAAAFVIIRFDCAGPLQVLYKWRQHFLDKSKSQNSLHRIKEFWLHCAKYWSRNNAGQIAKNNQELLAKFHG